MKGEGYKSSVLKSQQTVNKFALIMTFTVTVRHVSL